METVTVKVKDKVLKPISEVFDAIINPDKLSSYFISRASGPVIAGETVTWYFDDVGGHLAVTILNVAKDEHIGFEWSASGVKAGVDILLNEIDTTTTAVTITEGSFPFDPEGVKKAMQQTQGWTDFLCSMKAFLYVGMNLRKGRTSTSYK